MAKRSGKSMGRPQTLPTRSASLVYVRNLTGLTTSQVAAQAGLAENTVSQLETGHDDLSDAALLRLTGSLGVVPETVEDLLSVSEEIRDGQPGPQWIGPVRVSPGQLQSARTFGRRMGKLARETSRSLLVSSFAQTQIEKDREAARQLVPYLRDCKNLVERVIAQPGCHLFSVAEWLCQESIDTLPKDRKRAADCAAAAVAVAERTPGDERFRLRLGGHCWAHVGNVLRVESAFDAADDAFSRARELWNAGLGGDPNALLDVGRLLGMEASLRRAQGRFPEAMRLLREALPIATSRERPYLLLNYGKILELMGDIENSIRILEEASLQVPRHLLFSARLAIAGNLVELGRHQDAEEMLPELSRLALGQEGQEPQIQLRWLSARVAAGRGRTDEARGQLAWVRVEFLELGRTYDAALVTLDLAKLYLQRGETVAVRRLAQDMADIFVDVGMHVHAREALRLFQKTAVREKASVDLVTRVITYLERARLAPMLQFEAAA